MKRLTAIWIASSIGMSALTTPALAQTKLNALSMSQAAYSKEDVTAMYSRQNYTGHDRRLLSRQGIATMP